MTCFWTKGVGYILVMIFVHVFVIEKACYGKSFNPRILQVTCAPDLPTTEHTTTENTTTEYTTTENTTTENTTTEYTTTENTTTEDSTTENWTTTGPTPTTPTFTTPTATTEADNVTTTTIIRVSGRIICVTEEPPSTESSTEIPTTPTSSPAPTTGPPTTPNTTTASSPFPTPTTTTTTPPITTTRTPGGCSVKCTKKDSHEYFWSACARTIVSEYCNRTNENSYGKIFWECLESGNFKTDQPDYSNCTTMLLDNLLQELEQSTAEKFLETLHERLSLRPNENEPKYFGHEIETLNQILGSVANIASNSSGTNETEFSPVATSTVGIAERIIGTPEPWHHLALGNRSKLATSLILTIENTSLLLTSKVIKDIYHVDLVSGSQFTVTSLAYNKSWHGLDTLTYPYLSTDSVIKLPPGWPDLVRNDKIECVGMFMDPNYASLIMPGQFKLGLDSAEERKKILNGKIMSFTIASNSSQLSENEASERIVFPGQGVQIVFKHDLESWGDEAFDIPRKLYTGEKPKAALGTAMCVYWDIETLQWSGEGCKILHQTKLETTCECNHLTSFAILMDVHNYVGKNLGLEILTWILVPFSILFLIFTIIIFSRITIARNQRTLITLHLAICLCIGNFLVLLLLDKTYFNLSKGMCIASGIVIHYIFLAAFGWMGVQGAHLYHMVVDIFNVESSFLIYKLIGYGSPIVIIAITVMAGYLSGDEPYGGEVVCWLNDSYIWGFMGPVLIIVIINTLILSLSLWKSYRLRIRSKASISSRRVSSLRTWIQGSFALTVLLGITWLTGYFMLAPALPGIIAAYFFTFLNASQGIFIFIFDCFFNEKVRQGIHRQYGRYLPVKLDTWLKTTSSPSLADTTNTSVNATSTIRKRKVSIPSESNGAGDSINNSGDVVPPVPPPRGTAGIDESSKAVLRPRISINDTIGLDEEVKPSIWDGPRIEKPIPFLSQDSDVVADVGLLTPSCWPEPETNSSC